MFSIQDIERMSSDELNALVSECKIELEKRSNARRDELIQAVCDAMNTLHKEFPMVELRMDFQCPECALDDDFDVMEYFCGGNQMTSKDFYIY
jgi:hypothetical protein